MAERRKNENYSGSESYVPCFLLGKIKKIQLSECPAGAEGTGGSNFIKLNT